MPEEAAKAYIATMKTSESAKKDSYCDFLAGQAYATASIRTMEAIADDYVASLSVRLKEVERERDDARDACAWVLADPASVHLTAHSRKVIRGHRGAETIYSSLRAQIARLRTAVEASGIEVDAYLDVCDARDQLRAELESARQEASKLNAVLARATPPPERAYECLNILDAMGMGKHGCHHGNTLTGMVKEICEKFASTYSSNLEALAVVKKMREALEKSKRHLSTRIGGVICMGGKDENNRGNTLAAVESALSASPSLVLLEFAEKVWKEGFRTGSGPRSRLEKEDFLASPTYRSLTHATGDASNACVPEPIHPKSP